MREKDILNDAETRNSLFVMVEKGYTSTEVYEAYIYLSKRQEYINEDLERRIKSGVTVTGYL